MEMKDKDTRIPSIFFEQLPTNSEDESSLFTFLSEEITNKKDSIFECYISRAGEKWGQYEEFWCELTVDYLHFFNSKKERKYSGTFCLEYMVTEFMNDEISRGRMNIKFSKDQNFEELSTKDTQTFNDFRKELRKLTIQNDFSSRWEKISKIGAGFFAEVYIGKNKETK